MYISVRYIVGLAAFISGDFNTAFTLRKGLKSEFQKMIPIPKHLLEIFNKLNDLLIAELYHQIRYFYIIKKNINKTNSLINEADTINDKYYDILVLKSTISFETTKNMEEAISYTFKAKKVSKSDYTWLYNRAFLYMYNEDFEEGYKDYQKLSQISFIGEDSIVNQCLDFNKNLIENETNFNQGYFILGFLYYKKKNNYKEALTCFQLFLQNTNGINKFVYLNVRVKTYIGELKEIIKNL